MALDMEKLRKLLLVVLSSDQAGEVMAASSAIAKALKRDGRDIHWLVKQVGQPQAPAPPPKATPSTRTRWSAHWIEQLEYCLAHEGMLVRIKEADFIVSLGDQYVAHPPSWQPSVKQRDWLNAIYTKLKTLENVYGS